MKRFKALKHSLLHCRHVSTVSVGFTLKHAMMVACMHGCNLTCSSAMMGDGSMPARDRMSSGSLRMGARIRLHRVGGAAGQQGRR